MSVDRQPNRQSHRHRARYRPRPGEGRHRGRHLRRSRADPLPAGTERLPAHRSRQGDQRRLRDRRRVRRYLQPALRRHQSRHRRHRVRRFDRRRPHLAGLSTRRAAVRIRLLRTALRVGRAPGRRMGWPTSTTRTAKRSRRSAAATASPASRVPSAIDRSRRTSTCCGGCAPASSPTGRVCCAPRSTCSTRTCSCAIR